MTERARWYSNPMWWLVILLGVPTGLLALLLVWAVIDREAPVHYEGLQAGSYDPKARILSLQWKVRRNRYCPGELERTVQGNVGGAVSLPVVAIDPFVDTVDVRRARIGTSYVGRLNLIEVPKTVGGGQVKVTATLRFACNPMQYLLPILVSPPPVFFPVPNPEDLVEGTQPVTVGPPPE